MKTKKLHSYLELHFIVLVWGLTALFGKVIHIGVLELLIYRTYGSALAILLILSFGLWKLRGRARLIFDPQSLRKAWAFVWPPSVVGAILAVHWIFFFGAGRVSTASVSLVGLATTPLWGLFLNQFFLKQKYHKIIPSDWVLAGVSLLAIGMIYWGERDSADNLLGLSLSVIAALISASTTLMQSALSGRYHPLHYAGLQLFSSGSAVWIMLLVYSGPSPSHWDFAPSSYLESGALLAFVLLCTTYPYITLMRIYRKISPLGVNMAVNLEPVYGVLLASIFLGGQETMNRLFYIGMVISVLSTLLQSVLSERYNHKKALMEKLEKAPSHA